MDKQPLLDLDFRTTYVDNGVLYTPSKGSLVSRAVMGTGVVGNTSAPTITGVGAGFDGGDYLNTNNLTLIGFDIPFTIIVRGRFAINGNAQRILSNYNNGAAWGMLRVQAGGAIEMSMSDSTALSASQVRAEYLENNHVLFDGRLPVDGSCPVTLVKGTATSPIPGTQWHSSNAAMMVVEDSTANGAPAKRWIQGSVTGSMAIISIATENPLFGSWYFECRRAGAGGFIFNLGTNKDDYLGVGMMAYGLGIAYDTGSISLGRTDTALTLWRSPAGITSQSGIYRFWVTRNNLGIFTVWIRGPGYPTWTIAPTESGTNPTMADMTHTITKYYSVYSRSTGGLLSDAYVGDYLHYSCVMTPAEAIGLGLIDP